MRIDFHSVTQVLTKDKIKKFPTGSRVYKGFQGSGKTLSMVKYAFDLQKEFPACLVFSNIKIKGLDNYHYFNTDLGLKNALSVRNGARGVLVLLDEAHLFFNKKTGISLDVLTAISQQRKDRRRLVFSSQIWEELDISLRKQVTEICACRSFGSFIVVTVSNGETLSWDKSSSSYTAKKLYTYIYKKYDSLLSCYDTYQKIITNKEYKQNQNSQIRSYVAVSK